MIFVLLFELFLYFFSSYVILINVYGYITKHKKLIFIIPFIYLIFGIVDTLIENNIEPLILLTLITVNILLLKYSFQVVKIRSIILIFVVLYSANIILSSIAIFVLDEYDVFVKQLSGLSINLAIVILISIMCITKRSYLKIKFKLIPIGIKRVTILSLISSAVILDLISDFSSINDITQWEFSTRLTLIILVVIVGSAFPIMIANSIGKSFYEKQSKDFEQQIQTQVKHYEALSKSNYELRKFQHDYKNMRIGLSKYIQDGNIKEAEKMLRSCDLSLNEATHSLIKFDTANGIVDAILSEKQEKATTVNTVITFEGADTANTIDATDLCVIFGNTLDNALEACEKLSTYEEKTISIVCKCSGTFMFLTITNPVAENVDIHNNTIQTTKQDKNNHGFGIYSIQKVVDKYDGTLSFSCKDYLFECEVVLNI